MTHNFINGPLPYLQQLSGVLKKPITFIDLETTGMPFERHFAIIEIGLIHIDSQSVIEKSSLINPRMKIPEHISEITGIYDHMVRDKKDFSYFAKYINKIASNHILSGFNSKTFDSKGMEKMLRKNQLWNTFDNQIDFMHVFYRCRKMYDGISSRSGNLVQACAHHKIVIPGNAHRAAYDIALTALLAERMLEKYGFGILHKDIEKINCKETKSHYYQHIVKNKIPTIK